MKRWWAAIVFGATWAIAMAGHGNAFLDDLAAQAAQAERQEQTVIRGKEGWLFFVPELRSLGVGKFWGDAARKVSRAPKPEYADPLPAILDFKEQLDRAGIELLFVPVPAKATIYPDMISDAAPSQRDAEHLAPYHEAFYALLREKGVPVLDLTAAFLEARAAGEGALYARQDTHWSGRAVALAAEKIAERIRDRPWLRAIPKRTYRPQPQIVEITGDLWRALGDDSLPKERLPLTVVTEMAASGPSLVEPWRESPVLLLGDSHNLVYHAGGDLHARGAGLPDHLARVLGFPVDLVAVRGSGATPSRLSLLRRRDNLAGKRLVIWCLSVREFTEGQGWRKVPVIR